MNKKNNRKGFTIVELVIVIAVIAILATVLVPTFGDVISKAQNASLQQEAKALHTNYVMAETEKGNAYVTDCWVKIVDGDKTSYVEIVNGGVTGNIVTDATKLPTDCYDLLDNGAVATQHKTGCEKNAETGKYPCEE